ncbi:MAG: hypothetical protein A2X49_10475 [Lentisphaerae bacterium GWF2_52_8]|nr:MAG: hypothetical protein A2X49_10475 [Lentisphaerae bacterium GWF2_52_8]
MSMKIALIAAEENEIPAYVAQEIRADGAELLCKKCRTEDELLRIAADADIIWTLGPNLVLSDAVLNKLPRCRAIFRSGSGVDELPLEAAAKRGIHVCNSPEAIAESVAEHTVALLFSLVRQIPFDDRQLRQGIWNSSLDGKDFHISRRTLGLLGLGRIARHVVKMLSGFEMRFLGYDPHVSQEEMSSIGVEMLSLTELLKRSDYVSIHCPLVPATRHLIGKTQFESMKPKALLINTSRGAVIDEKALYEALVARKIGGAALDVTDPEPPDPKNPLLQLDNVIITPHVAAFSGDFRENFFKASLAVIKNLKAGKYERHSVNKNLMN